VTTKGVTLILDTGSDPLA